MYSLTRRSKKVLVLERTPKRLARHDYATHPPIHSIHRTGTPAALPWSPLPRLPRAGGHSSGIHKMPATVGAGYGFTEDYRLPPGPRASVIVVGCLIILSSLWLIVRMGPGTSCNA